MALVQSTPAYGTDANHEDTTMNRKTNKTTTARTAAATFEAMETRTMYSAATPTVTGYVTDYGMAAHPAMVQALTNSNAAATNTTGVKWEGLTQVNYFSVVPTDQGEMPGVDGQPATTEAGQSLDQLTTLADAAHANGVKVNLVVGGAGLSGQLRAIVNGTDRQKDAFAGHLADFARAYPVDGFDIDFEPDGLTADDVSGYGVLLGKCRTALTLVARQTGFRPTLSAAVMPEQVWLAPTYDTQAFQLNAAAVAALDQINVMTYDLGNPGDGAPIEAAKADMAAWVTGAGVDKSKLVMGLPFYGRGTTLTAAQMPANDPWGQVTKDNVGLPSYAQLVDNAPANTVISATAAANVTVTESIDGVCGGHPVAYHFDGPGTIAAKTKFAVNGSYAGVMIWDLAQDHFNADGSFAADALLPTIASTIHPAAAVTPTPTASQLKGSVVSSAGFDNGTVGNAFDGNTATSFTSGVATGWYGLHLNAPASITSVKVAPRAGYAYMMTGGTFQASNDPTFTNGNVTLANITAAPVAGTLTTLNVTARGTFAYVRYLPPAGSYGMAAEVQFFGTASAAPATATAATKAKPAAVVAAVNASIVVDSAR